MNQASGNGAARGVRHVAGWVPVLARVGYAAKGWVYGLVDAIAIQAGLEAGSPEGSAGALAELGGTRGGAALLLLIAIGLACHVLWRLVQAALDPEHEGTDPRGAGVRLFYLVSAVIYGSLAITAWQLARGQDGGNAQEDGTTNLVATLLQQPFGTWLVMLAGIGVMGYGLHQLYEAWKGDMTKRMVASNVDVSRGTVMVGCIGTAARGLVLLPVGWFVFSAGREFRAEEAAGVEEVLGMLGNGWLLVVVGVGLFAYGLHQVAKALYRRIARPS